MDSFVSVKRRIDNFEAKRDEWTPTKRAMKILTIMELIREDKKLIKLWLEGKHPKFLNVIIDKMVELQTESKDEALKKLFEEHEAFFKALREIIGMDLFNKGAPGL